MTSNSEKKICLVGAGKMGSALLKGWLEADFPAQFVVFDPAPNQDAKDLAGTGKISLNVDVSELRSEVPDILVLAVKPQLMGEVIEPLAFLGDGETCVLSIAAGRSIISFAEVFGKQTPIIRAMPNTPASIGLGMSVAVANDHVNSSQRDLAGRLLEAVGEVAWVDRETHLDAVTALSGSGPAYVFYMIECLTYAGIDVGLDEPLARKLAIETLHGAAHMAKLAPEDVAGLRENVTSPGGTTAAALDVLMGEGGLSGLMKKAVRAAQQRSKELAE